MTLFGMCVGRADLARPADIKPRLAQSVVIFRERSAPQAQMEQVAIDDNTLASFSRAQGIGNISWSERPSRLWAAPRA